MHHLLRKRMRLLPFTALLCALFLLMVACAPAHRKTTPDAGLELRLLHVNDTHAFLAGIDEHMNACFEAADCRGGLARISAAIQTARQEQDNVIALDAGDQFQGTLFYSVNKWPVIAAVDALLPYDAGTLLSRVREYGNVDSVDYRADGIWIEADVDRRLAAQIVDRAIDETDGDGSDHIDAEHDVD